MRAALTTTLAVLSLTLWVGTAAAQESNQSEKTTPKKATQDSNQSEKSAQKKSAGHQPKAFLGISIGQSNNEGQDGVTVREVMPNSPAAEGGLKKGDTIQRVGHRRIESYDDLMTALAGHKPGDKVTFEIERNGRTKDLTVTLANRTDE